MAEYKLRIIVEGQDAGATKTLEGIDGSLRRIGEFAAGSLLADGIKAMGRAVGGVGAMMWGAANDAAQLGAQVSGIAAVMNLTRSEVQPLADLIDSLAVNPNLKVSSQEAADAIEMLARNGLKLDDILGGAAESTVLLANATNADFGTAANVATDVMALWGIDANNMMEAVNGITAVTTNSKFSINDYALALAQGGGVAASVGVELEDFNATIAAISPIFGSGSDAGTSFKTMLSGLIPTSSAAEDAMAGLGFLTTDYDRIAQSLSRTLGKDVAPTAKDTYDAFVEMKKGMGEKDIKKITKSWAEFQKGFAVNEFFTASGEMKDMAEIAGMLNDVFANMSEKDRLEAMKQIFGQDGMRAAIQLAGYTEEEFRALLATMGKTDALESARTRMDNLAGDMTIFGDLVEGIKLKVGRAWEPALRTMYQSGTQILGAVGPLVVKATDSIADYLSKVATNVSGWLTDTVSAYKLAFEDVGGGVAGLLAGLGAVTGATVTFDADANVVDIDWGGVSLSFDADANVLTAEWEGGKLTIDAVAKLLDLSFTSNMNGFDQQNRLVIDGIAKLLRWEWAAENESGVIVIDAEAKVLSVDWTGSLVGSDVAFSYDTEAGIKKVNWQEDILTFIYDAEASITKVDFGMGLYFGRYTANASVTQVFWGAYRHVYEADSSVLSVAWGLYQHTYDAMAKVEKTSVLWGLWSTTYDAEADVKTVKILGMDMESFKTWFTSQLQLNLDASAAPAWLQTLVSFAWPALPGAPIWLNSLLRWSWPKLGESEDWVATLLEWAWPDLPTVETWLTALIAWNWPAFTPRPGWLTNLVNWKWPGFPSAPAWLTDLLNWKWPQLPTLPSWLGGSGTTTTEGQSSGTRFWRGGLTWVGEEGPELVNLPRGAQVFNSQRQMAMAGVGGGVTINPTFVVNSQLDAQAVANQVLDIIKRGVR